MDGLLEVLLVGLLASCIAGGAVLAVAEVSLLRVRRSAVMVDADAGDPRARQLLGLLDELPVVLNTVLLLVLLLQVGAATIAAFLSQRWFGGWAVTAASFLVTVVLFIYAEAIPKTMAVRSPERLARRVTPVLRRIVWIFGPVVAALLRVADVQAPGQGTSLGALTEDELMALAKESAHAGAIDEGDATLLERTFEFGDRCVEEVMVPRRQIAAIRSDQLVVQAFAEAVASGHRRLPVLGIDIDDVVGLVRLRDVAAAARTDPRSTAGDVMTAVLRCPPAYPIASLMDDMQSSGRWMVVVEDETGRTLGLATIEDLVAELVGEIADERAVLDNGGDLPQAPGGESRS